MMSKMDKSLTTVILLFLSLPVMAGSGYFYYQSQQLAEEKENLEEVADAYENNRQTHTLTEQQRGKLNNRLEKVQDQLDEIAYNASGLQDQVRNELNLTEGTGGEEGQITQTEGDESVSREELVQKIRNTVNRVARERFRRQEQQEDQRRRQRMRNRMQEFVKNMAEESENIVEEGSREMDDVIQNMDLEEEESKAAQEILKNYLSNVKDSIQNFAEKVENEDIPVRELMREGQIEFQVQRTEANQKLQQEANLSEKQANEFWEEVQEITPP